MNNQPNNNEQDPNNLSTEELKALTIKMLINVFFMRLARYLNIINAIIMIYVLFFIEKITKMLACYSVTVILIGLINLYFHFLDIPDDNKLLKKQLNRGITKDNVTSIFIQIVVIANIVALYFLVKDVT